MVQKQAWSIKKSTLARTRVASSRYMSRWVGYILQLCRSGATKPDKEDRRSVLGLLRRRYISPEKVAVGLWLFSGRGRWGVPLLGMGCCLLPRLYFAGDASLLRAPLLEAVATACCRLLFTGGLCRSSLLCFSVRFGSEQLVVEASIAVSFT
jgi:hypothetical protein